MGRAACVHFRLQPGIAPACVGLGHRFVLAKLVHQDVRLGDIAAAEDRPFSRRAGSRTSASSTAGSGDPKRQAIILVAGDKTGVARTRFYKALIAKADSRFGDHLQAIKER